MLSAAAGTIISALVAAAAGTIGSAINAKNTRNTNATNAEINQKNLDFQAAQTQAAWERDDTAHQREVADLEAAGLSPLASTSGASNSSPLGAPSPIAMQAPQLDVNALVQSALGVGNLTETQRHNKAVEKYESGILENQSEELKLKGEQLSIENKRVEEQIRYQTKLNELEAERLDEIVRSNKKGEELRLSEFEQKQVEYNSKRFLEEVEKQTGGTNIPYQVYTDFQMYYDAKKLYNLKLSHFIDTIGATSSASASQKSQGGNASGGAAGASLGLGASYSEGNYQSENMSEKQKALWYKFQQENKVPVYYPEYKGY